MSMTTHAADVLYHFLYLDATHSGHIRSRWSLAQTLSRHIYRSKTFFVPRRNVLRIYPLPVVRAARTRAFSAQEIKKTALACALAVLKLTRRYRLSRFHNYHRHQALIIRIRDGNARFHLDIVAGISRFELALELFHVKSKSREKLRAIDIHDQIFVH